MFASPRHPSQPTVGKRQHCRPPKTAHTLPRGAPAMALRQGGRALVRGLMEAKALPTRGGGGGPVKYGPAVDKQMPLWDELWWDDGLYHSQPVLDGTLEPQLQSPASSLRQLVTVLGAIAGSIWAMSESWSDSKDIYVPHQYPPEVLEAYTSRGKVQWGPEPMWGGSPVDR